MKKKVIAAFDFDGTITYCDSAFFFLLSLAGPMKTFWYLLKKLPILIAYALGRSSRQQTKEAIFEQFFGGWPLNDLQKQGVKYAQTTLPKLVRKKALERIRWHQSQGHSCVLVSASIDVYLEPWARAEGFEGVVTSRLEVNGQGQVSGKLDGLNCRREEKVRRIRELYPSLETYTLYAYGDSDGDKELLDAADYPFYRQLN